MNSLKALAAHRARSVQEAPLNVRAGSRLMGSGRDLLAARGTVASSRTH